MLYARKNQLVYYSVKLPGADLGFMKGGLIQGTNLLGGGV